MCTRTHTHTCTHMHAHTHLPPPLHYHKGHVVFTQLYEKLKIRTYVSTWQFCTCEQLILLCYGTIGDTTNIWWLFVVLQLAVVSFVSFQITIPVEQSFTKYDTEQSTRLSTAEGGTCSVMSQLIRTCSIQLCTTRPPLLLNNLPQAVQCSASCC